jgi:hypothetical protein
MDISNLKCSVHQPHFFPWLGYLAKIASSDVFVLLDDVQFTRRNFQNRCKIISSNGTENWISVPLKSASQSSRINQMEIAANFSPNQIMAKLDAVYTKSIHYQSFRSEIAAILYHPHEKLIDLTTETMKWLLHTLNIPHQLEFLSSSLNLSHQIDPNQRIIDICKHYSATQYIAGSGGKNYMHLDMFEDANIEVCWQDFKHNPIQYYSIDNKFHFGLSSLDAIFSLGSEATRALIYRHVLD